MSFTESWLERRIVNTALFSYTRHVTPRDVVKIFFIWSLLSMVFRYVTPRYVVKSFFLGALLSLVFRGRKH
jgi:hypothetical protein